MKSWLNQFIELMIHDQAQGEEVYLSLGEDEKALIRKQTLLSGGVVWLRKSEPSIGMKSFLWSPVTLDMVSPCQVASVMVTPHLENLSCFDPIKDTVTEIYERDFLSDLGLIQAERRGAITLRMFSNLRVLRWGIVDRSLEWIKGIPTSVQELELLGLLYPNADLSVLHRLPDLRVLTIGPTNIDYTPLLECESLETLALTSPIWPKKFHELAAALTKKGVQVQW